MPERACLLIADISGYSRYLSGVELDHAQDILADLIGVVAGSLEPGFRLAKLEGDAVFVYSPVEEIDGSLLLDRVEGCYFAFRRRLLSIRQATTCECNACVLIPNLDLKMVVHHGIVVRHQVAGMEELVGEDVIVAHRLLKNSVADRLGLGAYAFMTDACVTAAGLDPESLEMRRHREEYEHVGEVAGWVHDLERAWRLEHERRRVYIAADDATWSTRVSLAAPPEVVWEYVTSPRLRPLWQLGVLKVDEDTPASRRGVGTITHCVHGDSASVEEILDWRPPRYLTVVNEVPGVVTFLITDEIEPSDEGAILHFRVKARSEDDRARLDAVLPQLAEGAHASYVRLADILEQALGSTGGSVPDQPVIQK